MFITTPWEKHGDPGPGVPRTGCGVDGRRCRLERRRRPVGQGKQPVDAIRRRSRRSRDRAWITPHRTVKIASTSTGAFSSSVITPHGRPGVLVRVTSTSTKTSDAPSAAAGNSVNMCCGDEYRHFEQACHPVETAEGGAEHGDDARRAPSRALVGRPTARSAPTRSVATSHPAISGTRPETWTVSPQCLAGRYAPAAARVRAAAGSSPRCPRPSLRDALVDTGQRPETDLKRSGCKNSQMPLLVPRWPGLGMDCVQEAPGIERHGARNHAGPSCLRRNQL